MFCVFNPGVHSMSLDNSIMTCIYHYCIIQSLFTTGKIPVFHLFIPFH